MLQAIALHALRAILPDVTICTNQAARVAYEADAGLDKGSPAGVIFPRSSEELQQVVRWAQNYHIPLVARGAGTGLSGGAVAEQGGLIVEFTQMNRLQEIDLTGRTATVEPALINLHLDEQARLHNLYFPPDPASQRASTIGGNVAENAGGPHCFKYGVTTNYVMGLECILADGSRIHAGGRTNDYPAYDLCGLLTGSEGTLGLITSITVRLLRNPPGVRTLLALFHSIEQAGNAVSAIIAAGLVPATMEMMDQQIIRIVEPFAQAGLPLDAGAVLIIEVDGYQESLSAQIKEIVALLTAHGGYGVRIAHDDEERYKIWLARKSAAGAMSRLAPAFYIIDITVPRSRLTEMLLKVDTICQRYGLSSGHVFHAGDGNLHPNLLIPDPSDEQLMARVHQAGLEMVTCCVEMDGSITGEHGVGIEKRQYMPLMHNATEMQAMWDIKLAFDPDGILNPGKIFPTPSPNDVLSHEEDDLTDTIQSESDDRFEPQTEEEAVQGLRMLYQKRCHVSINAVAPHTQAVLLTTQKLTGVTCYAPDDLYITVKSGTRLTEIQEFLRRDGKQLALASPWPETTIGGLVSTNSNAPLRMRYGAIRDLVLSTTVALPDGRIIRTGRPLVKNVAGYDLTKLFIGAHGTLGLLTNITLKIMAQPRTKRTLLLPVDDISQGLSLVRTMQALALTASAILLCKGYSLPAIPQSRYLLIYTAEGLREDVEVELAQVRRALQLPTTALTEVEAMSGTEIWADMLGRIPEAALLVRVGLPPKDFSAYVLEQTSLLHEHSWIVDMASGLIYAARQFSHPEEASIWLDALRKPALAYQGYAVVMTMPAAWQDRVERWGYTPEGLPIMQRLKSRWDPHGLMNAGVFMVA